MYMVMGNHPCVFFQVLRTSKGRTTHWHLKSSALIHVTPQTIVRSVMCKNNIHRSSQKIFVVENLKNYQTRVVFEFTDILHWTVSQTILYQSEPIKTCTHTTTITNLIPCLNLLHVHALYNCFNNMHLINHQHHHGCTPLCFGQCYLFGKRRPLPR